MANIVTSFIGPLLGAGLVPFGLNYWKAERNFVSGVPKREAAFTSVTPAVALLKKD
jgi:hypothetical protein